MVLRTRSVPEGNVGVERGMEVVDPAGSQVGRVHGLTVDPASRTASHIVLRRGPPVSPSYRLLPTELVADVREDRVKLNISAEHVDGLPPYEPNPKQ